MSDTILATSTPADDGGNPAPDPNAELPNTDTPPKDGAAPGDTPPAEGEADKAKTEEPKATGAPETYEDFKLPEGATLDDEEKAGFIDFAKSLDLTQAQAQILLDKRFERQTEIANQAVSELDTHQKAWVDSQKTDKEYGGDKYDENMALVVKAANSFATKGLIDVLNASRLGDHPEVVRFFYRVGKALQDDKFIPSGDAPSNGPRTGPEALYPSAA